MIPSPVPPFFSEYTFSRLNLKIQSINTQKKRVKKEKKRNSATPNPLSRKTNGKLDEEAEHIFQAIIRFKEI